MKLIIINLWCFVVYIFVPYLWTNPQIFVSRVWKERYYIQQWVLLFFGLFSFMMFCMEMYMELQLDLPLLSTCDVLMELIDVYSNQPHDENAAPSYVELKYYCHGLVKPSKVNPLHVIFGLRGVLARQGKSFKPCTLTLVEWYKNPLANLYFIPRLDL